eukprot:Protomagalhaensia_wolfi_Nauph_80__816@NODE_1471_length_1513_cov_27_035957_g1137_i0_p2_GENE_NODE_1471_length_1513_cov_27_035957_g1137_i0NODE_1471_length_1513_cov_27_035957_g1137_i0_p2_ORF_typecomplete_len190_score27_85_NODE_1471_length_1513_cov_27_035957_g1137_i09431482
MLPFIVVLLARHIKASTPLPSVPYYSSLVSPGTGQGAYWATAYQVPTFSRAANMQTMNSCQILGLPCIDYGLIPASLGTAALNPAAAAAYTLLPQSLLTYPNQLVQQLQNSFLANGLGGGNNIKTEGLSDLLLNQMELPTDEELMRLEQALASTFRDIKSGVEVVTQIVQAAKSIIPSM